MKIVIAGAGAVGFHLAALLANEDQDITLIDTDEDVLSHAATHLDVMTIRGDAASTDILEQANIEKVKLFLAVTTSEKTNLLVAILAKQMGAKKTIARVSNPEYLEDAQKEVFQKLGVDILISPQILAAQEIKRLLQRGSFTDVFEFEKGKISVVGFKAGTTCPLINKTIAEIDGLNPDFDFKSIAILRGQETIIPDKNTVLRGGDYLYLVAKSRFVDGAMNLAGSQFRPIKRVMIIGSTAIALRTAQLIENDYAVTIVMADKEAGKQFLESLHNTLIVIGDPSNVDLLKEEGLDKMDAFLALTPNSETNIITSLMADEIGVYKTIAMVDNVNYTHISQNIGVDTIINKKLIAANEIFRYVRKGQVEAIVSLHGVDAEMIEFVVHKRNRLLTHSIQELHMPKKSVIAGVVRGEQAYIPNGDFQFEINDKVIVFALPEAIHKVEEIFK
ncbi:MAG: Trk system potassium transporter TrkA [Lewinellaceae bacterium]|nr:Trk system potassium transporter TrkA [Saprospiraceae bacterium]MCB9331355.1 Trk system potassium transporter TrkA [Lewinellaceae bacterium]